MGKQIYVKIIVTPEQVNQLKKGRVGIYVCAPGHKFYITCKEKQNSKLQALLKKKAMLEKAIKKATGLKRTHHDKKCGICGKVVRGLAMHNKVAHEGFQTPVMKHNGMRKPVREALHGTVSGS